MIQGIDHIELVVRDVDAYVTFFEKLGFKLLTRTFHHGSSVEMQVPGPGQPIFEIHQVGGEEVIGINHIAFKVDSVETAYAELQRDGVSFQEGPKLVPSTGRTNANLRDPDGSRLQLVDSDRKLPG